MLWSASKLLRLVLLLGVVLQRVRPPTAAAAVAAAASAAAVGFIAIVSSCCMRLPQPAMAGRKLLQLLMRNRTVRVSLRSCCLCRSSKQTAACQAGCSLLHAPTT